MNLLSWVVFGLLVGVIVNILDPQPSRGGVIGAMILGIAGALLGGFLTDFAFGRQGITGFNLPSLIVSVIGALILLFLGRMVQRS